MDHPGTPIDALSLDGTCSSALKCRVCQNTEGNRSLSVREMMFGMAESFTYLHCAACGVLHLVDIPSDLSRYYPSEGYYSVNRSPGTLKRWVMNSRDRGYVTHSIVGKWLLRKFPNSALEATLRAAQGRETRILDVGCGGGDLLQSLSRLGFNHLYGVDPLLDQSASVNGVHLIAGDLGAVTGEFDLITFHHSLEHMPQQATVLMQARERLARGGQIIVRVPTCDSFAFELYGSNWFQIDAPRHLFLHTRRSIDLVARQSHLKVEEFYCDSQSMQFWASDMYKDDVILNSPKLTEYKTRRKTFYRELSTFINAHLRGDQVVVHLRPA